MKIEVGPGKLRIGDFILYREKAGVVSEGPMWVMFYGSYLHFGSSLYELLKEVMKEYKNDKHLVG